MADILTKRERQIVTLRERGLTMKEVAAQLGISIHTVRAHSRSILAKTRTISILAALYKLRASEFFDRD